MKTPVGFVPVLLFSLLMGACSADSPEIDQYMVEMAGLANKLIAIDAAAAQGLWQEAGQDLEQTRVSLAAVDAGIDELANRGVDSKQLEKGRAASTYLHQAAKVSEVMISWYQRLAEVNPEGLTGGSGIDNDVAIGSLNELITLAGDARSLLWDFLEYGQKYYASDTDGARKLKAEITIPRLERLYNQLDDRIAEFEGYLDTLSQP